MTDKITPATPNPQNKGQSNEAPVASTPIVAKPEAELKVAPGVASVTKA